jgi:hypothetical protein
MARWAQGMKTSLSQESEAKRQHLLLRVGREVDQVIGVLFNLEVEAPIACGPSLPEVAGLVVLLGPEGRVAEILEQEGDAAVNRALDLGRRNRVAVQESLGVDGAHQRFLSFLDSWWSDRTRALAELKGP